jgi:hypothetical protein
MELPDQLAKHVQPLKQLFSIHLVLVGWFTVITHFRSVPYGLASLTVTFTEFITFAVPLTAVFYVVYYVLDAFDVAPRWRVLGMLIPPALVFGAAVVGEGMEYAEVWRRTFEYLGYAVVPVLLGAGVYEWFSIGEDGGGRDGVDEGRRDFLKAMGGVFVAGVPVTSMAMHEPAVTVKWTDNVGIVWDERLREGGTYRAVDAVDRFEFLFEYEGRPSVEPSDFQTESLSGEELPDVECVVWGYDEEEYESVIDVIGDGYYLRPDDELVMEVEYADGESVVLEFWMEDVPRREKEDWAEDD